MIYLSRRTNRKAIIQHSLFMHTFENYATYVCVCDCVAKRIEQIQNGQQNTTYSNENTY